MPRDKEETQGEQDERAEKYYLVVQHCVGSEVVDEDDVSFRLDFSLYGPLMFGLAIHTGVMAAAKTRVPVEKRKGEHTDGCPFIRVFLANEARCSLGQYSFSMDTEEQAQNALEESIKAVRKKIIEIIRHSDGNQ